MSKLIRAVFAARRRAAPAILVQVVLRLDRCCGRVHVPVWVPVALRHRMHRLREPVLLVNACRLEQGAHRHIHVPKANAAVPVL